MLPDCAPGEYPPPFVPRRGIIVVSDLRFLSSFEQPFSVTARPPRSATSPETTPILVGHFSPNE